MKKMIWTAILLFPFTLMAQETQHWTEADRNYLIDNLIRSRDELVKETKNLSMKQSQFKESPDRWSINQIVEHLAIWELIFDREISRSLGGKAQPDFNKDVKPDSYYTMFIMEETPHITTDFTKPFTFTVPMGLNDIKNNITWFLKMRNESIEYLKSAEEDLRLYYRNSSFTNLHQTYIYVFGHIDRHLRQIKKIKDHPNYPK